MSGRWLILGSVLAAVSVTALGLGAAASGWLGQFPWSGTGLFCHEHGVPEKFCTLCHDELKTQLVMCDTHGLPDAICTVCHPENEQKYALKMICDEHRLPSHLCPKCQSAVSSGLPSDWCGRHGVPRSLCIRCQPELTSQVAMCAQHGVPEALCTICRPELSANFVTCKPHALPAGLCDDAECRSAYAALANVCPEHGVACSDSVCQKRREGQAGLPLVRFAGPDVAARAGIDLAPVRPEPVQSIITATGEVGYDETRLAHVRARVSGLLREVRVKPGDTVRQGQVLAIIDSAELGQAKADYLAAMPIVELWQQAVARNRNLNERAITAEKQVLEAEAELRRAKADLIKAEQRLRNLGLDDEQLRRLDSEERAGRNAFEVTAPQAGTIVRRRAVAGEAIETMAELVTIADLSRVWVHLDVYERDLRRIRTGQPIRFRVPGLEPEQFSGVISWIDTEVSDVTRTIHVRAEIENREGLLRANMFGTGEIQLGDARSSLVVPDAAVQWEGLSYVVFVRRSVSEFEPRRVLLGRRADRQVELAWADLKPGELVATTGSFLLKTEIQKGAIGAGCCGE